MKLIKTNNSLDSMPTWGVPLDLEYVPHKDCMKYFDQNGYDLTPLEQEYARVNSTPVEHVRWRSAIKKDWFTCDSISGIHLNHADLYERKGYHGYALEQISCYAEGVPTIYKLMHMKPKWGIDISIDYVDAGKAFEVFHYEWDDFDYNRVADKQALLEDLIFPTAPVQSSSPVTLVSPTWSQSTRALTTRNLSTSSANLLWSISVCTSFTKSMLLA